MSYGQLARTEKLHGHGTVYRSRKAMSRKKWLRQPDGLTQRSESGRCYPIDRIGRFGLKTSNSLRHLMQQTRTWIGRLFWTGAVLTLVSLLACVISLILLAVGDQNGSSGVWGVFLVAASAWVINFVSLVALLAWRVVHDTNSDNTSR